MNVFRQCFLAVVYKDFTLPTLTQSTSWNGRRRKHWRNEMKLSGQNVRWPRCILPVVSHVVYAPLALLRLEKDGTDRQTDRQTQTVTLHVGLRLLLVMGEV